MNFFLTLADIPIGKSRYFQAGSFVKLKNFSFTFLNEFNETFELVNEKLPGDFLHKIDFNSFKKLRPVPRDRRRDHLEKLELAKKDQIVIYHAEYGIIFDEIEIRNKIYFEIHFFNDTKKELSLHEFQILDQTVNGKHADVEDSLGNLRVCEIVAIDKKKNLFKDDYFAFVKSEEPFISKSKDIKTISHRFFKIPYDQLHISELRLEYDSNDVTRNSRWNKKQLTRTQSQLKNAKISNSEPNPPNDSIDSALIRRTNITRHYMSESLDSENNKEKLLNDQNASNIKNEEFFSANNSNSDWVNITKKNIAGGKMDTNDHPIANEGGKIPAVNSQKYEESFPELSNKQDFKRDNVWNASKENNLNKRYSNLHGKHREPEKPVESPEYVHFPRGPISKSKIYFSKCEIEELSERGRSVYSSKNLHTLIGLQTFYEFEKENYIICDIIGTEFKNYMSQFIITAPREPIEVKKSHQMIYESEEISFLIRYPVKGSINILDNELVYTFSPSSNLVKSDSQRTVQDLLIEKFINKKLQANFVTSEIYYEAQLYRELTLASRVKVSPDELENHWTEYTGIIRWEGKDKTKNVFYYGVELDFPVIPITIFGRDNSHICKNFFDSKPNQGVIVTVNKVHPFTENKAFIDVPIPDELKNHDFLGMNSVVEVEIEHFPNVSKRYSGQILWMGTDGDGAYKFGIELVEPIHGYGTDGTFYGQTLFKCLDGCGILVRPNLVWHDSAFPLPQLKSKKKLISSKTVENPTGPLFFASDVCSTEAQLSRGIQGDSNSCYMDSTLTSMFLYNLSFDVLLNPNTLLENADRDNDEKFEQVRRELAYKIVYSLRSEKLVSFDHMKDFRENLQSLKIGQYQGLTNEEKDPEELINMFSQAFIPNDKFLKIVSISV